jgi:2,4'-dihydroxyacetophenone dioxygenase
MDTLLPTARREFAPARLVRADATAWMPSSTPGKRSRPLRFLDGDRGFVELMALQPGVAVPLHRHTGEVHAWNLEGTRRLCTGEIVGPGDYVHEPAGNTDWWVAVGEVPLRVLVVVMGAVEYLAPDGRVLRRIDTGTLRAEYAAWCRAHGAATVDPGA